MSYDKQKALQILENMLQGETDENVRDAVQDLEYALSLALVAYTEHLLHWADIPEHADDDMKQYWAALHNIHNVLTEAAVFLGEEFS